MDSCRAYCLTARYGEMLRQCCQHQLVFLFSNRFVGGCEDHFGCLQRGSQKLVILKRFVCVLEDLYRVHMSILFVSSGDEFIRPVKANLFDE